MPDIGKRIWTELAVDSMDRMDFAISNMLKVEDEPQNAGKLLFRAIQSLRAAIVNQREIIHIGQGGVNKAEDTQQVEWLREHFDRDVLYRAAASDESYHGNGLRKREYGG